MASAWVVVPTYWGPSGSALYDHPTPLDGESTLPRLLESLAKQEDAPDFAVLLLVSAVSPDLDGAAAARAWEVAAPYLETLDVHVAGAPLVELVSRRLGEAGLDEARPLIGMRGYARVRNMQLLIPAVMGAQAVLALDDDEVAPPGYVQRAMMRLGKDFKAKKVIGSSGPYLDAEGSPYISEPESVNNILVDKSVFMNRALRALMETPEPLSVTPMVLGGNMLFHRDLFTQVSFDPAITRGEDIDYLINARIQGHVFHFDPGLVITHLPPRHYEAPEYGKRKKDVIRFIYEKEKIRLGGLPPESFDPYPGCLFTSDIYEAAREALAEAATPEMVEQFGTPEAIIEDAKRYAAENAPRCFEYAELWPRLVEACREDEGLRAALQTMLKDDCWEK